MALSPLATVADLEARGVTVSPDEVVPVNAFLATASALVRDAAGSPISEVTSVVSLEGGLDQRLRLPGLPVRSVSAVLLDGVAVTDWRLASGALFRAAGWQSGPGPSDVQVTYVHGLAEVPDDVVDMVCRLAGQELAALRSGGTSSRPLKSERIGDYAAEFNTDAETGTMSLTDAQRRRLAARFGGGLGLVRSR